MLKAVTAALFVTVSSLAYAQAPSARLERLDRLNQADMSALTDARVNIVKSTLALTPDQEKLWPAIEDAIRARSKDRQARLSAIEKEADALREKGPVDALRDRNPVDFMHRRADALAQRATDLKKLADAWQPLYQTLTPDQRKKMGHLAVVALREMRNPREHRHLMSEQQDDDE
jgi:hypothetical protein